MVRRHRPAQPPGALRRADARRRLPRRARAHPAPGRTLLVARARTRRVTVSCTCDEDASPQTPCPHLDGTLRSAGDMLAEDPWLLFHLRGRVREQVLRALRRKRGQNGDGNGSRDASASVPDADPPNGLRPDPEPHGRREPARRRHRRLLGQRAHVRTVSPPHRAAAGRTRAVAPAGSARLLACQRRSLRHADRRLPPCHRSRSLPCLCRGPAARRRHNASKTPLRTTTRRTCGPASFPRGTRNRCAEEPRPMQEPSPQKISTA